MSASSSVYQIPEELRTSPSWVLWKKEYRDGKLTKVLYQTNHRRADSTAPSTWTTFEDAVEAFEHDDSFDGVGFVFHPDNPYCGADIDDVTEDEAQHWIEPDSLEAPVMSHSAPMVHILSPFDPLVIQRKRLKLIFDYEHRFEAYVPADKRVLGYFALPVLVGRRIAAAIDLKMDRRLGKLLVQQWTWIDDPRPARGSGASWAWADPVQ